jgi:hypothetical protein
MESYSIRESTTGKYITTVGISDITLDSEKQRKIFNNKADAENVADFCNATISDSFALVKERKVSIGVNVTGTVYGEDEDDDTYESMYCYEEDFCDTIENMDTGALDNVDIDEDEEGGRLYVSGTLLIHGLFPDTATVSDILDNANDIVATTPLGDLEDVHWTFSFINDEYGNPIYTA